MVSGKPSGPYFLKEDRVITEMKNGPNILLTSSEHGTLMDI